MRYKHKATGKAKHRTRRDKKKKTRGRFEQKKGTESRTTYKARKVVVVEEENSENRDSEIEWLWKLETELCAKL